MRIYLKMEKIHDHFYRYFSNLHRYFSHMIPFDCVCGGENKSEVPELEFEFEFVPAPPKSLLKWSPSPARIQLSYWRKSPCICDQTTGSALTARRTSFKL